MVLTAILSNLAIMKRITGAILAAAAMVMSGCTEKAIPTAAPEFTQTSAEGITFRKVTLTAAFSETSVSEAGFFLRTDGSEESARYRAEIKGNRISAVISGLESDATYECQAYISNAVGNTVESDWWSFRTGSKPKPGEIVPIEDPFLKAWLLVRYDSDNDDEISIAEGERISQIEITSNDVTSLNGIEYFPNLSKLHCQGTLEEYGPAGRLSHVDVSQNSRLSTLYLINNRIESIIFPEDNMLGTVEFNENKVREADMTKLTHATRISCSGNLFKELDFRGLSKLEELSCDTNRYLETIQLDNRNLKVFRCFDTAIKELDLSKCPLLNSVDCSGCPSLEVIYLSDKQVIGTLTRDSDVRIEYR